MTSKLFTVKGIQYLLHYKKYTICQKIMLMQMCFSSKIYQPEIHTVFTFIDLYMIDGIQQMIQFHDPRQITKKARRFKLGILKQQSPK